MRHLAHSILMVPSTFLPYCNEYPIIDFLFIELHAYLESFVGGVNENIQLSSH
jgi:hypothetical protein